MDNDELDAMDIGRWLSLGDGARELGEEIYRSLSDHTVVTV